MMRISLVYASAPRTVHETVLEVPDGSTLAQALTQSGWREEFPETATLPVGVWNHRATRETLLREDSPEQIDSWNRVWAFLERHVKP